MQLTELEEAYKSIELPDQIVLDKCTKIFDTKKFVEVHFKFLKNNRRNRTFKPYYDRLIKIYYQHKK